MTNLFDLSESYKYFELTIKNISMQHTALSFTVGKCYKLDGFDVKLIGKRISCLDAGIIITPLKHSKLEFLKYYYCEVLSKQKAEAITWEIDQSYIGEYIFYLNGKDIYRLSEKYRCKECGPKKLFLW